MRKLLQTLCVLISASAIFFGCTENKKTDEFPQTPPEEVVMRFYELIAEGGKITSQEALILVSDRYRTFDINDFRRWTQDFDKESKIEIAETILPTAPNESGDMVAVVKINVKTPSIFGGYFTTTSRMNLILDEETNSWKIDFMADTIDESEFLEAPTEVKAENMETEGEKQ